MNCGHNYVACGFYRHREAAAKSAALLARSKKSINGLNVKPKKIEADICIACEMDRYYLSYFERISGENVVDMIEWASRDAFEIGEEGFLPKKSRQSGLRISKGEPLDISNMLTAAWRSGGMKHLAGYDQRDAHEFLNAFLELIGKGVVRHEEKVYSAITMVGEDNAFMSKQEFGNSDIVSALFEGSLRSVLLCQTCGNKRVQAEPFRNISLSLSEEMERLQRGKTQLPISLDLLSCLDHFTSPEDLGDLVYCSLCAKKTPTTKQHTFSKIPKVLCLHLKRFDAVRNRKIEESVSYPARGLDMGRFLSHWSEVSRVHRASADNQEDFSTPAVLYDLFATVNHIGSMQSGH